MTNILKFLFKFLDEDKCYDKCKKNKKCNKKCSHNDCKNLKIQTGYGQTISPNVKSYITPLLENYAKEHKGGFIYGGNIKSSQSYFTSTGTGDNKDNKITKDSIYWWASSSKIFTGLVITKMIEESIISPYTKLYELNKLFVGKGTYYTSIKIINSSTFPFDPSSYEFQTDTFNWDDVTLSDLIHMNIGLITDYIVVGALGPITFSPEAKQQILADGSIQSLGTYIQLATYFYRMISGNPIGLESRIYAGEKSQDVLVDYLEKLIDANKSGILPLISKPNTYITYNLPYGLRGIPSSYDTSYLFVGSVLDPALKKAGYKNYADYARKKFFIPMNMKNSWIVQQEVIPQCKFDKIIDTSWRRAPTLGLTQNFDINNPSTWFGFACSSEYRNASSGNPKGPLVWSQDKLYENDGLSKMFSSIYNTTPYPNLQAVTNAPLVSSISDYSKLIKMVCNRGFYKDKQILKTESWNYLIGVKIPPVSITTSSPYPINRDELSSQSWAMGFGRINRDLSNITTYGYDETSCFWAGLSGCYYLFDYYTGNYVIYGMPESRLSSGTLDIPGLGTPAYNAKITSEFLIKQIK